MWCGSNSGTVGARRYPSDAAGGFSFNLSLIWQEDEVGTRFLLDVVSFLRWRRKVVSSCYPDLIYFVRGCYVIPIVPTLCLDLYPHMSEFVIYARTSIQSMSHIVL